ncbi:MAG: tetratricopeptide repeat protein [Myxococcaceae bacterium]
MLAARAPLRRAERWAALLPLIAVLAGYAPVATGGFAWDDHLLIEQQGDVTHLAPLGRYFGKRFWSDPLDASRSFYRPLTTLSYALQWAASGGAPQPFHLANVALHLLVALCLFALCRRAGAGPLPAAMGVALFSVLPRLTESVAWISGRTDVLATLFVLVAFLLWTQPPRNALQRWGAAGALLAGLLCKEVALAGAAGLFAFEWSSSRGAPARARAQRLGPVVVALAAWGLLRAWATLADPVTVPPQTSARLAFPSRLAAAFNALGEYVRMICWPWRPALQIGSVDSLSLPLAVLGGVAAVGILLLVWKSRRRLTRWQALAAVTAGAALGMVLPLVPLNIDGIAADRFLYLPAAMLTLLWVPKRPLPTLRARGALAASALLLASFVWATSVRAAEWSDEYTLWRKAVERRSEHQPMILLGYANVLMDAELYGRALPVLDQLRQELASRPDLKVWNSYAVSLDKVGRREEARALLADLAARAPNAIRVRLNLALVYARAGQFEEAQRELASVASTAGPAAVEKVSAVVNEAHRRLAALNGAEPSLAKETERAEVADLLGANSDAERHWRTVLLSPEASPELRERAAGYLAFHAEPLAAAKDLDELEVRVKASARLPLLREIVADRDRLR